MIYRPTDEEARVEDMLLKVFAVLVTAPVLAVHIYQMFFC